MHRNLNKPHIPHQRLPSQIRRITHTLARHLPRLLHDRRERRRLRHVRADHVDRQLARGVGPGFGHLEADVGAAAECQGRGGCVAGWGEDFGEGAAALAVGEGGEGTRGEVGLQEAVCCCGAEGGV